MPNSSTPSALVFPSLISDGRGLYRGDPRNFVLGFLVQAAGLAVLAAIALYVGRFPGISPGLSTAIENIGSITYPFSSGESGGHGGGGDHERFAASRGALPTMTLDDQLTPPQAVLHNLDPKLPEPPSVMAQSEVKLPQLGPLGDPLTGVQGPPSNGSGREGGIGRMLRRSGVEKRPWVRPVRPGQRLDAREGRGDGPASPL